MMQDKVFTQISKAESTRQPRYNQALQASSYLDEWYCYALDKRPLVESPRQFPEFFRETL
jgi:hypothetical protein